LEDYKYAPEFDVCLFSLMKAIEKGWTLSNEGTCIVLKKKKNSIKFDRITKTTDGMLCGVELLPCMGDEAAHPAQDGATPESESGGENSTTGNPDSEGTSKDKSKQIYWNINRYHKVFGHASEDAMKATAKFYGWKLTGTLEACEDCQMSNAQQKNVPKTTSDKCKDLGQRIFVDMSSVSNHTSLGGAKVWLAAVDDATGALWSHMMKKKSDAPDQIKNIVWKLDD
jgi:hypothetical protein